MSVVLHMRFVVKRGTLSYLILELRNALMANETKISGKTAIARSKISRPTRHILKNGHIKGGRLLHLSCGKAAMDTRVLSHFADEVAEYDPNHAPNTSVLVDEYDFVVANYVVNTLPPLERNLFYRQVNRNLGEDGVGFIAVRSIKDVVNGDPDQDGLRTLRGTFQKTYTTGSLLDELLDHFDHAEIIGGGDAFRYLIAKVQ